MAVATLEVLEHRGNGERQKKDPDDDGDMRRFLQSLQEVLAPRVDDVKIPVDGSHGQEGDAGSPVEEQHEEHGFAEHVVAAPPFSFYEVVGLYGQTEEQQNVRQHQVEQENVVAVGFPELQLEYEEVEDGRVERQRQDKNQNHDRRVEFIQMNVCDSTFFYKLVHYV